MFPRFIQVQTQSQCHGRCLYCPYPFVKDSLPQGTMPPELFKKIAIEAVLSGVERFVFYLMNEPLLDPQIFEYMDFVRHLSSEVWMEISTNAIALDARKGERLAQYDNLLLMFNVNRYTPIDNIVKFMELGPKQQPVAIIYDKYMGYACAIRERLSLKRSGVKVVDGIIDDRAGNVPDIKDGWERNEAGYCMEGRLEDWFHVLYNGDVIICCQDWRRTTVLGNMARQTIKEIYNSSLYWLLRDNKPELCKKCARWLGY